MSSAQKQLQNGFKCVVFAFVAICVFAGSQAYAELDCSKLLLSRDDVIEKSIHDLALLRLDLDQKIAGSSPSLITFALAKSYEKKSAELSFLIENLDLRVKNEIQKLQGSEWDVHAEFDRRLKAEQQLSANRIASVTSTILSGRIDKGRYHHTQTVRKDGSVIIVGGDDITGGASWLVERVNPALGTIEVVGRLEDGRTHHRTTLAENGDLIIVGGQGSDHANTNTIAVIEPTGRTGTMRSLAHARSEHGQSLAPGEMLVVTGGLFWTSPMNSVEVVDLAPTLLQRSNPFYHQVRSLTSLQEARYQHGQSTLRDGKILVVGGRGVKSGSGRPQACALSSIELIDPVLDTVESLPPLIEARYGHVQMVLPDGKVLVMGGYGGVMDGSLNPLSSIELIDPILKTVEHFGNLKQARANASAVMISDSTVVVMGGETDWDTFLDSIEAVNLNFGESYLVGNLKDARTKAPADLVDQGRILISGGRCAVSNGRCATAEVIEVKTK